MTVVGIFTVNSEKLYENVFKVMIVSEVGTIACDKEKQCKQIPIPILVTEVGIVKL